LAIYNKEFLDEKKGGKERIFEQRWFSMKKLLVVLSLLICSCSTTSNYYSFDNALEIGTEKIQNDLPTGAEVAILDFKSDNENLSAYVIEEMYDKLINFGKLSIMERSRTNTIAMEIGYQFSGEVDDSEIIAIGHQLGADYVVTGQIIYSGEAYRLRVFAIDIAKGRRVASSSLNINPNDRQINYLLTTKTTGKAPIAETTPQTAQKATPIPGFVRVEGGTFQMGSNNGETDEMPVHTVTVKSFSMAKYPVTQKEWIAVMGNNPSYFKGDNLPVECVSWYDMIEYCNRFSEKEGLTPAYTINKSQKDWNNESEYDELKWTVRWNRNTNGYRLPTEAEWEYAAKGGNGSPGNYAYAGSNNVDEVAWYGENSAGSTQEVGAKKPNGLGLYDMNGNVWEWCWDWYGAYGTANQTDPIGASSGSYRVSRGGSRGNSAQGVRSTLRGNGDPSVRDGGLGFRLVRP
jgi:formylglycine-generating enzyme required for sulfatase activity